MTINTATKMNEKSGLVETYGQFPFGIERGQGAYVWDTAGKKYLDFYGGHAVACLGHSPKAVADAIYAQANKMMFYSNLARIPIRSEAATALLEFGGFNSHSVFFCNSGGEANENALKIAIKTTGRHRIVGFEGGFHGRTLLAVGATDHPDWHEYLGPWIGPVAKIKPNDLDGLREIDAETACVILEPIQSIGKVTEFKVDYLKALRARCDEVGAKLIFDEVQTGIGRTGVAFVSTGSGVVPDMTTLAKGLAGGFPIGAVIMTDELSAQLKVGDIAATFGGSPMAMAAMIATLSEITKQSLVKNTKAIEEHVRATFKFKELVEIRGKGCLLGLKLNREAKPIQQALFKEGIIVGLNSDPNQVHLLPPLNIEKAQVDELREKLGKVLGS